jgi:hypothetical protein
VQAGRAIKITEFLGGKPSNIMKEEEECIEIQ